MNSEMILNDTYIISVICLILFMFISCSSSCCCLCDRCDHIAYIHILFVKTLSIYVYYDYSHDILICINATTYWMSTLHPA